MVAKIKLIHGDCLDYLKIFIENESIDSLVCDPPYGLSFMGKDWDKALPPTEIWAECFRVLKPGGYIIAMSASRMYHRLAVQLEDIGFITHPMIGWIYGSGFPKATDLSKQFDKWVEREVIGEKYKVGDHSKAIDNYGYKESGGKNSSMNTKPRAIMDTIPQTDLAKKWDGWKYGLQSLKPALEPIYVGQKPWKNKHIKRMTENVEKYGVGAFNIDACRVEAKDQKKLEKNWDRKTIRDIKGNSYGHGDGKSGGLENIYSGSQGRHPANLLHDGSESVEKEFLEQGGIRTSGNLDNITGLGDGVKYGKSKPRHCINVGDKGSASRFFNNLPITKEDLIPFNYIAKASKSERNKGLEDFEKKKNDFQRESSGLSTTVINGVRQKGNCGQPNQNHHPCVKPIKLMEWLVKLVTPKDGTCLDPFMGSGTTGIACKKNNFNFIGIEKEKEYFDIAKARIL